MVRYQRERSGREGRTPEGKECKKWYDTRGKGVDGMVRYQRERDGESGPIPEEKEWQGGWDKRRRSSSQGGSDTGEDVRNVLPDLVGGLQPEQIEVAQQVVQRRQKL